MERKKIHEEEEDLWGGRKLVGGARKLVSEVRLLRSQLNANFLDFLFEKMTYLRYFER